MNFVINVELNTELVNVKMMIKNHIKEIMTINSKNLITLEMKIMNSTLSLHNKNEKKK